MLLKYFYDQALAHASYMVGCQKTKEALIVDPGRDVDQYLEAAAREGLQVTAVAETHIHADYVSGARELADRVAAKLYLSDAGPDEWKYEFAAQYNSQLVVDGDRFHIGKIMLEVMHTPGHTPESVSFLLTDTGGGADQPMGIFTGDFVFVGSIGRPDLLEEAAGLAGTAESGARDLFRSIQRFKQLPDHLQLWPAHGAGSACGKGLGAVPSSTVGYEKRFNSALQYSDEQEFVDYILSEQPEAPKYFAVMKRVNKEGPELMSSMAGPAFISSERLPEMVENAMVVDTARASDYASGHVPGTFNIPAGSLANWAGWVVDYQRPLYLVVDQNADKHLNETLRVLRKIGIDQIGGLFSAQEVSESGLRTQSYESAAPDQLAADIADGSVLLLDVRSDVEWNSEHIDKAHHAFLGKLRDRVAEFKDAEVVVTQCLSGGRSAIAASILQAAGASRVINMAGGITAWKHAGLPVQSA